MNLVVVVALTVVAVVVPAAVTVYLTSHLSGHWCRSRFFRGLSAFCASRSLKC